MSTNIDERVVKMSFDDTGFEAGANKAIGILDNLKKALNLEGASTGIESAQKAVNGFNMDSVSESVEACSSHFSAFEAFMFGVFARLGQQAANLGETIVKRLTVQGAMDGFKEYELQMGSIQTILSNTGDKLRANGLETQEEQIGYINERLDELNEYADKTIYNFSQMTRNIGLFTAAGIDLDTATSAIQGISNLAAASGADNAAAARAMYNLSQAISTGTVRLMDWNSVVNAGMGGELFQNALKRTARVHGVAVDEIIAKQGSFRDSLSEGWLTADILTETLEQMTIEYDEVGDAAYNAAYEQLRASGYSDDAAVSILDLAKNASEAATKVRTWTQLWDTIGESIGSGWAQTWRTIVGDFLEATDLFTWFSDKITGVVNASSDARNAVLEEWAAAGGRKSLVDTLKNIYETVEKPLLAVAKAFSSVFGVTAEQIYNITTALAVFTSHLVLSDEAAEMLTMVFTDVFSVLHSILAVMGNAIRIFVSFAKVVWTVVEPVGELAFLLFGYFADGVARLAEKIAVISDAIEIQFFRIGHGFAKAIADFLSGSITFDEMIGRMKTTLESVRNWLIRSIEQIAPQIYGSLVQLVKNGFSIFIDYMESFSAETLFGKVTHGIARITRMIYAFALDVKKAFSSLMSGNSTFLNFTSVVSKSFKKLKENISRFITNSGFQTDAYNLVVSIFDGLKNGIYSNVSALWEWAKSIGETILNAVKSFLGIQSPSKAFFEVGKNVILGFVNGIREFLGNIKDVGSDIGSIILTIVDGFIAGIKNYISTNVSGIFEKLPEPIQNSIKSVKTFVDTFFGQAKKMVTGTAFFHKLVHEIWNFKNGMSVDFIGLLKSFGRTILDVFGSLKSLVAQSPIGTVFSSVAESVSKFAESIGVSLPSLKGISEVLSGIFDSVKNSDAFTSLSGTFESIPTTFTSLFEQIAKTIFNGKDLISKEASKLSFDNVITNVDNILKSAERVPSVFEETAEWLKTTVSNFLGAFSLESLEEHATLFRDILDLGLGVTFMNFVKSLTAVNKSISGIVSWPKELGKALKSFGEGFTSWRKETKADAVLKIAFAIAVLAGSLFLIASIPAEDLARAGKAMAIMSGAILGVLAVLSILDSKMSLFDTASMLNVGNAVESLGIGVLAFAAALFVLSKIPADTMGDNIITLVEIAAILALLAKAISSDGKAIKSGAIGMIFMAVAVYAMAKAVEALGKLDADAVEKGIAPFVAIMLMLTLFGKFGGEGISSLLSSVLKFGAGVALIALSFVIFAAAIAAISAALKNTDNLPQVLMVMGGMLVAFVVVCKQLDMVDTDVIAKSLITFAASLIVMALAIGLLASIANIAGDGLRIALVSFGALIAAFGALSYLVDPVSLEASAKALSSFAKTMIIMAAALALMTLVVSKGGVNFAFALGSIIGLLVVFGALSKVLSAQASTVQVTAGALVIFSIAIGIMAGAMLLLNKVKFKEVIPQLIAIVAAFALFAVGASALSASAAGMVAVGVSMLIFSTAVLVLAGAFWILVDALENLTAINPLAIVTRLSAMGVGLGAMVVNFVTVIFSAIGTAITEHLPELFEFAASMVQALIDGILALGSFIMENGGAIISMLGDGIGAAIGIIPEKGGEIVTKIIEGIQSAFGWLQENGGDIVDNIGEGIIAAKDAILPKVTEFINGIKEKLGSEEFKTQVIERGKAIGQAVLDGIGMIFDGIGDIVSNLFDGLKSGITEKLNQVKEWGISIGNALFGGAQESLEVQSPSKVFERIGGFVLEGLANGVSDLSTITDSGIDIGNALIDAMNGLPDTLFAVGQSALSMFGIGISKDNGKVGGYAKSTSTNVTNGFNGLGSSLKLKASTAMTQFGSAISSAAGSLVSKAGDVIRSVANKFDSLKSTLKTKASNAMAGFASGFSSGNASSAAKNVVTAVSNSISATSLYNKFSDIGKYAVQGLVDGINKKRADAERAARAIADVVTKSTKKGLNEKSPSKVFKQIGEYVVEGLVIGINGMLNEASSAGTLLGEAVPLGFSDGLSSMMVDVDDLLDTDYSPVITPVINAAEFDSNLQQLSALMNSRLANDLSVGNLNYNETFAGKLDAVADINKQAMQQFAENAIDYDRLGVSVANALIRSGVHVEMDGGQLMGYLAGEIKDVRRMYG